MYHRDMQELCHGTKLGVVDCENADVDSVSSNGTIYQKKMQRKIFLKNAVENTS